jgi:tetratricopeptide (TPR) repeat protein
MLWRALLASHDGQRDDASHRLATLGQRSDATVHVLNEVAWLRVATNLDLPDALDFARRAAKLDPKGAYVANTLAGVEAETGELHAAIADLRNAVQLDGRAEPSGADWFVLGRILEQAGLRDDAIAAYGRVTKTDPELFGTDSYTLATNRLKALGAKP